MLLIVVRPLLKKRGEGFRGVESVAGGQGVTQDQQGLARGRIGGGQAIPGQERQQQTDQREPSDTVHDLK